MPVDFASAPIARQKVYQQVAERLEELMRSGALAEGEFLPPERELMRVFGVGRPAVREAMLSLEKSGVVLLSNGERARVSRPTADRMLLGLSSAAKLILADPVGMKHFQAARRVFEVALVREAARNASEPDIAALRSALERNAAAEGNSEEFERTDVGFHLEIIRIAGNPIFLALHRAFSEWLIDQRRTSLQHRGAEADALLFHRRIFEAISARHPDGAEQAMQEHLEAVNRYYWQRESTSSRRASRPRHTERRTGYAAGVGARAK